MEGKGRGRPAGRGGRGRAHVATVDFQPRIPGSHVAASVTTDNFSSGESTIVGSARMMRKEGDSSGESTIDFATTIGPESTISDARSEASGSVQSYGTNSSVNTKNPKIPKEGIMGREVQLVSNYLLMNKESNFRLIQYRVDFEPPEDETDIKKDALNKHKDKLGAYIFDGHMMFKPQLQDDAFELDRITGDHFTIIFRIVGHVGPTDAMFIQFYNCILRNCLVHLKMEQLGRHFYDPNQAISMVNDGINLWPGLITAIRNHDQGTLLCLELTHKVLRTERVSDVMRKIKRNLEDRRQYTLQRWQDEIQKELIGSIVITEYNRRTYRIDGFNFDHTPASTFPMKDKNSDRIVMTSYSEYYLLRYDMKIDRIGETEPLIISNPRKRDINKGMNEVIHLIPALCNMTGYSDAMRRDFNLMKRLSEHLHKDPTKRMVKLDATMEKIRTDPKVQEEFNIWHVDFDPRFLEITGRVMKKEKIFLDGDSQHDPDNMADWTTKLKVTKMLRCMELADWVILSPGLNQEVDILVDALKRMGRQLGMNVTNPKTVVDYRANDKFMNLLNDTKRKVSNIGFVFCILPNNNLNRYAEFKKAATLKHGLPSQCFLSKHFKGKTLNSICTKVMIQVNAKLGGEPWRISNPFEKVMVLGFDVYHCPERKNESVGALVATTNKNLSQYFSTVSFHKDKSELSTNMCKDIKECLLAYLAINGFLPEKIILFRDGVGEGQINYVVSNEVEQIKLGLTDAYPEGKTPKLTVIVVTKKINSRVIVKRGTGNFCNPEPGTVVDTVITLPERHDFFLVSQSVRQGTVSPTNYNIIFNDMELSADKAQIFSYKMCHMYYNWSGTVAVPAPCQYAHKLAYLTGMSLADVAPENLRNSLWYL